MHSLLSLLIVPIDSGLRHLDCVSARLTWSFQQVTQAFLGGHFVSNIEHMIVGMFLQGKPFFHLSILLHCNARSRIRIGSAILFSFFEGGKRASQHLGIMRFTKLREARKSTYRKGEQGETFNHLNKNPFPLRARSCSKQKKISVAGNMDDRFMTSRMLSLLFRWATLRLL